MANSAIELQTLIKNVWPDFPVTKELLLHPTADFVIKFFAKLIDELNDKMESLINSSIPSEFGESQEFGPEVQLFSKVASLYSGINNYEMITLNDFYQPNPRRNMALMKLGIHFLLYVDNMMDDLLVTVGDCLQQGFQQSALEERKQQRIEDVNNAAERICHEKDEYESLCGKLDEVLKAHAEMMVMKKEKDKLHALRTLEAGQLHEEHDNLKYRLDYQEEEEKNLSEKIVTESDFLKLKEIEEGLEHEKSQLSVYDDNLEDGLAQQKKVLEHFSDCASALKALDFDRLLVKQLEDAKELLKQKNKQHSDLKLKLDKLLSSQAALEEDKTVIEAKISTIELREKEISEKNILESHQLETEYKKKLKEHHDKVFLIMKFNEKICQVRQEMDDTVDDEKALKNKFFATYKKILDAQSHTVTKFTEGLNALEEKGSSAISKLQ